MNSSKEINIKFRYFDVNYNINLFKSEKSDHSVEINSVTYEVLGKKEKLETACKILRSVSLDSLNEKNLEGRLSQFEGIKSLQVKKIDKIEKEIFFQNVKIAAAKDATKISKHIASYGFNAKDPHEKEMLFEIAKIAIVQDESGTSSSIRNYGFNPGDPRGKQILFEIAKIAAAQNGWGTSMHIANYGFNSVDLRDKEILFEIAKISAAQNGLGTTLYIKKYGFNSKDPRDKEILFEITKIAIKQDVRGTSESLANFGFDPKDLRDKEILFEIAKIAAKQNGEGTSENIANYGFDPKDIRDKEMLFEIAKIVATQSGKIISKLIRNYGFDTKIPRDKEILFEIVKIAAGQNPLGITPNLTNYGFESKVPHDKEILFEIAKIAVKQDVRGTSEGLASYGFDPKAPRDKEILFEIAKIAAAQNGIETSLLIEHYGLHPEDPQDKERLFEIAKIAVLQVDRKSVIVLFYLLKESFFNLTESETLLLFRQLYVKNPSGFFKNLESLEGNDRLVQIENIFSLIKGENILELHALFPNAGSFITALRSLDDQCIHVRKLAAQHYLGFLICQSLSTKKPDIFFDNVENLQIIPLLEKVYDPDLRLQIISHIGEHLGNSKLSKEKLGALQLSLLLFDSLFPRARGRDAIIKTNRNLRDGKMSKALMKTIIQLNQTPSLSKEDSGLLLEKALNDPKKFTASFNQLKRLYATLNLDGGDLLQTALKKPEFTFASTLEEAFKRKLPLLASETNFAEQFLATFNESRAPLAMFQYAAALSKLQGEVLVQSMKAFTTFITSVLNNTFYNERMKLENNPHLKMLHDVSPELLKKWTDGASKELLIETTNAKSLPLTGQLQKFFFNQIAEGEHLEEVDLFKEYLREKSIEKKTLLFKKLKNEPVDSLQKALIDIIEPKFAKLKILKQKSLINALRAQTPPNSPFLGDFDLLEQIIEGKSKAGRGVQMILSSSDNPYDLLLCGVEVAGSCQSIHGNPNLNRGVLGYLLNGHRMIILKEAGKKPDQKPIIGRSIFRLLLNDKNPVLLLERIYPQNLDESYKTALKQFALEVAVELKCPLVSAEEGDMSKPFAKEVKSLGGRFDEYVDASGGVQKRAIYSTRNTFYVT